MPGKPHVTVAIRVRVLYTLSADFILLFLGVSKLTAKSSSLLHASRRNHRNYLFFFSLACLDACGFVVQGDDLYCYYI